jgi:nicotinate dehydrogenase subunit B
MVHARIVRPPAERAELVSIELEAVERMPGVLNVVCDGNFLGVVAEREGQARAAARALAKNAKWNTPNDLPESSAIYEWLKMANSRLEEVANKGSVDVSSTHVIRATYQRPHQAHASISPAAAVALYDASRLTVWSHAQGMYPLREAIAHTLDMPVDKVRCIIGKPPDATAITARMMRRAMRQLLRSRYPGDPFGCSGSEPTNSDGNLSAPPCRLRSRLY